MKEQVVIVGGSHAAAEAVTTLRKNGWEGGITLIGDEPILPYHRPPLSKAYFNGAVSADKLLIRGAAVYENADVRLRLGARVTHIDRLKHHVTLDDGEQIAFTKLILATGARARRLPVKGADLPNIFTLRSLQDVDEIKSALPDGGHLLIVGAGYIGLEAAASAIKAGYQVTVLEAMDRVLSRVTSPVVSEFFQRKHAASGVDIRLEATLAEFAEEDGHTLALLGNGEKLAFDCAIVGIGVDPNIELAQAAGLPCDNGVVVDEFTQTADPDIFAVGDCCNHPNAFYQQNLRLESVPNAIEQGKIAAMAICGQFVAYDQVPWFWSDQYDIKLQTVGLLTGYDDVVIRGDLMSDKFSAFYFAENKLIAVDAINSPADFMLARRLIPNHVSPDKTNIADVEFSLKTLL